MNLNCQVVFFPTFSNLASNTESASWVEAKSSTVVLIYLFCFPFLSFLKKLFIQCVSLFKPFLLSLLLGS